MVAPTSAGERAVEDALAGFMKPQGGSTFEPRLPRVDARPVLEPGQNNPAPGLEGRKDDGSKAPWHLLPYDALDEIVEVLRYGAEKYAPRNWEKGMAWSRPFAALQRHMTAWWMGEDRDPETGYSHLAHAGCCILFLIAYEKRGAGEDDRGGLT